jgi:ABC-type sugar transport system permease subunit
MASIDAVAERETEPSGSFSRYRAGWNLAPYLFIAPFFVGFLIFQLLPILFSGYLSLSSWSGLGAVEFQGLENFVKTLQDARFLNAFKVTFVITAVCTVLGTVGALTLAILLEQVPDWLSSLLRVIFFLPSVTSVVVITYVWKQLFNVDFGFFNTIMLRLGLPPQSWLTDPKLALGALVVMLIWAGLGWDALIITAGLRAIPGELYDAAKVDGANGWKEFWHITLPLLRPTLAFVLVTSVIFLWGLFAQAQLLTDGGPLHKTETIALYLYDTAFRYHRFGYASAIAIALSFFMFVSSYLNFRLTSSDVQY